MTQHKKNTGDFTPKYNTVEEICQDDTLLPSDVVREKVKHHAMCLFALATDMATAEDDLQSRRLRYVQLINENKELRNVVRQLQVVIKSKSADDVDKLKRRIAKLQQTLKKHKEEAMATPKTSKPRRINDLTTEERQAIQADYYEQRIQRLQWQVKYWREKAKGATDNGK